MFHEHFDMRCWDDNDFKQKCKVTCESCGEIINVAGFLDMVQVYTFYTNMIVLLFW